VNLLNRSQEKRAGDKLGSGGLLGLNLPNHLDLVKINGCCLLIVHFSPDKMRLWP
jgi:hypothetical protein